MQENRIITHQQHHYTKLLHQTRVSQHALQFDSCKEQISATTRQFLPGHSVVLQTENLLEYNVALNELSNVGTFSGSPGTNLDLLFMYRVSKKVSAFGGLWNKKYVTDIQN